jgi:Right handed beta helix region
MRAALFTLFAALSIAAHATTRVWPGTTMPCGTTLQACVNGSGDSDTIQIATDGPIDETIETTSAISFVAAPGFHPVFAEHALMFIEASEPSSSATATVTIDGLQFLSGWLVVQTHNGNLSVTVRHVQISSQDSGGTGIYVGNSGSGTVHFNIGSNRVHTNGPGITLGSALFYEPTGASGSQIGTIHDNRIEGVNAIELTALGTTKVQIYSNQITDSTYGMVLVIPSGSLSATILNNAIIGGATCENAISFVPPPDQVFLPAAETSIPVDVRLFNNTIARCQNGVVLPTNATGRLTNNMIANNGLGIGIPSGVSNDHNLVFGNTQNRYTPGPHTISSDPHFAPGGVRLAATSPAIDAADSLALRSAMQAVMPDFSAIPEIDADGSRRFKGASNLADIGAYEFGDIGLRVPVTSDNGGIVDSTQLTIDSLPQLIQNPTADTYVAQVNETATALSFSPSHFLVVDEDGSAVLTQTSYTLFSPAAGNGAFLHASVATNIVGPVSQIDNDYINGHPERIVMATHLAPQLFAHPFGLEFIFTNWSIIQSDAGSSSFPSGLTFNVYAQDPSMTAFKWQAPPVSANAAVIHHPLLDSEPCAHVFATADHSDAHAFSVGYVGGYWLIFNLDGTLIPSNAGFSIVIDEAATDFCKFDHIFHDGFDPLDLETARMPVVSSAAH